MNRFAETNAEFTSIHLNNQDKTHRDLSRKMPKRITLRKSVAMQWSFAILLTTLASFSAGASVNINNAWIRSSTGPNGALFLELENDSPQLEELVEVTSSPKLCDHMELHTHKHENGKMMMRQVSSIEIPGQSKTELKPGGLHIMFMGLKKPLKEGDMIPIQLEFKNGESIELEVPVKSATQHLSH